MGLLRNLLCCTPARSPKRSEAPIDFFDYTRALDAVAERHLYVGSPVEMKYMLMCPERAHEFGKGWSSQPGDTDPLHWALYGRTRLQLIPCDDPDTNIYPLTLNTPDDVRAIVKAFSTLDRATLVQHPAVPAILADPHMQTIPPRTAEEIWDGIEVIACFYHEAAEGGREVYSYVS
jgi:hypothetical protein